MARVPNDATAFAHREKHDGQRRFVLRRSRRSSRREAWVSDFAEALSDDDLSGYVGFLADEGQGSVFGLPTPEEPGTGSVGSKPNTIPTICSDATRTFHRHDREPVADRGVVESPWALAFKGAQSKRRSTPTTPSPIANTIGSRVGSSARPFIIACSLRRQRRRPANETNTPKPTKRYAAMKPTSESASRRRTATPPAIRARAVLVHARYVRSLANENR